MSEKELKLKEIKSNWNLDGSSIPYELLEHIVNNLEPGKTILELGSGKGTELLSQFYNVISIEHDPKYVGLYDSDYIFAPLKRYNLPDFPEENFWYDVELLKIKLKGKDYDFILVDGPNGGSSGGRSGFYYNYDLFKQNVPILIDDLHRPAERRLFDLTVQKTKNCNSTVIPYKFNTTDCYFGYIEFKE